MSVIKKSRKKIVLKPIHVVEQTPLEKAIEIAKAKALERQKTRKITESEPEPEPEPEIEPDSPPVKMNQSKWDLYLEYGEKKKRNRKEMSLQEYTKYYRLKSMIKKRKKCLEKVSEWIASLSTEQDFLSIDRTFMKRFNVNYKDLLKKEKANEQFDNLDNIESIEG